MEYRALQKHIEDVVKTELEGIPSDVKVPTPNISYKDGETTVSFSIPNFFPNNYLELIELVKGHYDRIDNTHLSVGDLSFTAILNSNIEDYLKIGSDKFGGEYKQYNEGKYTKFRISNRFSSVGFDREYNITLSKKGEFSNEEVDCVINLWKKYAIARKNEVSIEDRLSELGVILYKDNSEWTWDRLVGYEKAKIELQETIVSPYNDQEIYQQMVRLTRTREESIIPRAVLLEGPPGTGKTTAARIIANDSGIPLIYIPLEKIMSVFYSGSSSKLSNAFDLAYEFERAIVFIDELDALAGTDDGRIHEETKRMISVLQRRLDGFESKEGILVLGATNKVDSFVAPILNRFSRIITFGLPEFEDRTALFEYYAKHLSPDDVKTLAEKSEKYCCRDIRDICADAERIWIKRIKDQGLSITPPGLLIYQQALKHKTPIKTK